MNRRSPAALLALALPAVALAGCGDSASDGDAGDGGGDALEVVASFYPLQEAVEEIGGDHVEVTNLTKPGAEAHDVELSPKDVLTVKQADAVVYLSGFQPAVDDAVKEADTPFDVTDAADLDIAATDDGHDHRGEEDGDHEDHDDHADEEKGDHDHGAQDPHFWLDPVRYAGVGDAIAEELARVDPDNAETYRSNAKDFRGRLEALDETFHEGLESCTQKELVTSHAAFGYLADAYGFHQEGITGLSPETEPGSRQMADLVTHIREHDVTTIYAETLVPRDVADAIAKEAGAEVEVLDPIEGITDESAAKDYFGIMEANLETLKKGQDCS